MAYQFKHGDRPLDGFAIQRAVGSGGFGEVYYALSDGGREVALKYLKDNPQTELRGVSHCMNLKSPHLVSIFDIKKSSDGDYFIVMEYCSGPSLRDLLIAEPDGLGAQKAAFFVREIAKGLSYLHERGIVHRDLKPGNIFYDDGYVKIGDYGLSKFISVSRHSAQTASVGTVHYMAPEIGSGDYSRGVDIYALGVILYEMLLGKVPYEGSSMGEILMKHLTGQPEVDNLPEPFGKVIRKALEKSPKDRYQTVDEMMEDLLEVEEVKNSLAGFTPVSLDGAVAGVRTPHSPSPIPSPNPVPPPLPMGSFDDLPPFAQPLPDKYANKVDRISRKIDKRIRKLEGRHGRRRRRVEGNRGGYGGSVQAGDHQGYLKRADGRRRRPFVAMLTGAGIAVLCGLAGGAIYNSDTVGSSCGLFVFMLSLGLGLSRVVMHRIADVEQPDWVERFVRVLCCTPFAFIGAAPLIDMGANITTSLMLGLLVVIVMANWREVYESGGLGELSFWKAAWIGLGALIATSIIEAVMRGNGSDAVGVAFIIAAGVSLVTQAWAWWLPAKYRVAGQAAPLPVANPSGSHKSAAGHIREDLNSIEDLDKDHDAYDEDSLSLEDDAESNPQAVAMAGDQTRRWQIFRMLWCLVLFVLVTVMTACIVLASTSSKPACIVHASTGIIECSGTASLVLLAIACGVGVLFSLTKVTPYRRPGFWRETLRPLLICGGLFGVGASITRLSQQGHYMNDGALAGAIVLLVGSALFTIFCLIARGKRKHSHHHHESFLVDSDDGEEDEAATDA